MIPTVSIWRVVTYWSTHSTAEAAHAAAAAAGPNAIVEEHEFEDVWTEVMP